MCRMCEWLGDGQTWYLNPKNYAYRLYRKRDPGGRAVATVSGTVEEAPAESEDQGINDVMRQVATAKANGDLDTSQRLMQQLNQRQAKVAGCRVLTYRISAIAPYDALFNHYRPTPVRR